MADPVGSIAVRIWADTSELRRNLEAAQGRLKSFGEGAAEAAKKVAMIAAAAIAAATALGGVLVRRTLEAVDAQAKLARQIGGSVQAVQTLDRAASLSGVPNLTKAAQTLTTRLGEVARTGAGPAKRALDELGLTVDQLMAMDADARFVAIAEAMDQMGLTADQRLSVLKDFGIRGAEMANLFEDSAAAIRQAQHDVVRFGTALSDVDARQIERANDALSGIGEIVRGVGNQFTAALAPYLAAAAEQFNDLASGAGGWRVESEYAIRKTAGGLAILADQVQAFLTGALWGWSQWRHLQLGVAEATVATAKAMDATRRALGMEGMGDQIAEAERELAAFQARVDSLDGTVEAFASARTASERLRDFFQGVERDRVEGHANLPEFSTRPLLDPYEDPGGGVGGGANDNQRETMRRQLEAFEDFLADREQREIRSFHRRREELHGFLAEGLITEGRHLQLLAELEAQHHDTMAEIRDGGFAAKLERLDEELQTEEERQLAWYQTRQAMLEEAIEREVLTREEAAARMETLEAEHMRRLGAIREAGLSELERFNAMSYRDQAATVLGEMANLTAGISRHNRAAFNANKIAGIANAIISAHEGIAKTMAAYPYPLNIGMAAAHGAAAFAQVQAIRSATFSGGGGGTAPSVRGSTPAPAVSPVAAPAAGGGGPSRHVTINLQGSNYTPQAVRDLIEAINEELGNGMRLAVTPSMVRGF